MEQIRSIKQFIFEFEKRLIVFPQKKKFDAFLKLAKFVTLYSSQEESEVLSKEIECFAKDLEYLETFMVKFIFDQGSKTELGIKWGPREHTETGKKIKLISEIVPGSIAAQDGRIKAGDYTEKKEVMLRSCNTGT